jgi:hypothetical protein
MPKESIPGDCRYSDTYKVGGKQYRCAYRHVDFFLGQVLDHDHYALYTMNEIRKKLDEKTGVYFHGTTIEKYIKRYKERHGESPLCQVGDKYRLNHCYYSYAKIKPPRPRKYKIEIQKFPPTAFLILARLRIP